MRKFISLLLLISIPLLSCAQFKKLGNIKRRQKIRKEYIVGIGGSNYLGELGGANQIGTYYLKDFELAAIRPSLQVAMRYRPVSPLAIKGGLYFQMISGDDRLTKEPYRQNRNLNFRSPVIELSTQAELFLTKDKDISLYNIRGVNRAYSSDYQVYLFVGIGGFFYNPQGKYNGKWYNLQPLSTEGQGLAGGPKKYSRFSICIPYGVGMKYGITKDWTIGVELGIRKTFTDYLDDVSTVYYDKSVLLKEKGTIAAHFADPSLMDYPESLGGNSSGAKQTAAGQQRGNPSKNDTYMFTNITVSYKMPYRRRTRSKF